MSFEEMGKGIVLTAKVIIASFIILIFVVIMIAIGMSG